MKIFWLFLVAFLSLQISAQAKEECGYGSAFEDIVCPVREGFETTLVSVSYSKGLYSCKYADGVKNMDIITKKIPCSATLEKFAKEKSFEESDSFNRDINQNIHTFSDFITENQNKENMMSDHFIGSTNFVSSKFNTHSMELDVKKFVNGTKVKSYRNIKINGIDSHTKTEKTLGAIITGVFTLDPEFFRPNFINEMGELELKSDYRMSALGSTSYDKGDGGIIDSLKGWFGQINGSSDIAGEAKSVDSLSFMDKQVLGYLVYLGIGFKKAYMDIIYLILGLGMFWSFGFYMYKKSSAMGEAKDDFNVNKTSWLMGAGVAIAFFVSPIIHDGAIKGELKNAVYNSNIDSGSGSSVNWSTPAQEALRYFLQSGNYFGNLMSDYGMHSFLSLVSYKQGVMNNPSEFEQSSYRKLQEINSEKLKLGAEANFYNKICKGYFSETVGSMINNSATSQSSSLFYPDVNNILKEAKIGADRLDYDTCSQLEKNIQTKTNNLIAKSDIVKQNIKNMSILFNGDDGDRESFQRYINTMIYAQNQFGWINVPIVPISYFFFKNADYFAYNSKIEEGEGDGNVFKNVVSQYRENDIKRGALQKTVEGVGDVIQSSVGFMIETSFWFVVPGFESIYSMINTNLQKSYLSEIDTYNALTQQEKSSGSGFLKKTIGYISSAISHTPGLGGFLGKLTSSINDNKKSKIVSTLISIISLFVAIYIIKMIVEGISITAIAIFLAIKITLFLLEILFFYFISPAIGVFYAIMNNGQSKNFVGTYFQNLAVLAITPILLVVTTYLIIVVSEFLHFFFLGIINLLISLLNAGAKDLYASSDSPSLLGKTLTLSMIQGISEIFVYFAVLVIATIMIFNFRGWFTKLIGIEHAADIMKEGGNEMKQGVSKYVNPVG